MKKAIVLLMVCVPFFLRAQTVSEKGIRFEQGLSWSEIKDKAKAEHKYIFMDVFATWCGPCKLMDKEVYPNDTVGHFMNSKFISVKVQVDSSNHDEAQVKKWYADAHFILQTYKPEGYPSFLFFTPDGTLAFKGLGYQNAADFLDLSRKALNPENLKFYTQLEDYKKGQRDYVTMQNLALFTITTLGDKALGTAMAKDYVAHTNHQNLINRESIFFVLFSAQNRKLADSLAACYKRDSLDHLNEHEIGTKRNLLFLNQFDFLVKYNDNVFTLAYNHPEKVDSVMGKGWAKNWIVESTMMWDLHNKIIKDGKPVFRNPDWNALLTTCKNKFPRADVRHVLLPVQIDYYENIVPNCQMWVHYRELYVKYYPPVSYDDAFFQLNMPAWQAFLHCDNKIILQKALAWVSRALAEHGGNNGEWLDTKANLLYKLGRVKEALPIEEKAAALDTPSKTEIEANLAKMKNGEATWLSK